MRDPKPKLPPAAATEITEFLRKELAAYGFDGADVSVERDHDGDWSVVVKVHYAPRANQAPFDPSRTLALVDGVVAVLEQHDLGDLYPYIRHLLYEDQAVLEAS